MHIAVVGLGYIGLPTAAILAGHGNHVTGVDVNPLHVDAVNRGEVPFVEPDLSTHVAGAVAQGALTAQLMTPKADVYIIAVPTPFADDHSADLSYIDAATDAIIPLLCGGELIILESTSPPGTTAHLGNRIESARPDLTVNEGEGRAQVDVAHCPERVLPGRVMVELVTNDRIVGGLTSRAAARAKELYQTFCTAEILLTDAGTAEMAKLTENAFRDVNIAFANELSMICDELDVDVFELIDLANHHPRVNILQPGPGVGGHCIAVDPWFIVSAAPAQSKLIRLARQVNDSKPEFVVRKVLDAAQNGKSATIAALGLAFKPDIDDMRESPAIDVVASLADRFPDGLILAVEPHIDSLPHRLAALGNVELTSLECALDRSEIVLLLVDHREFRDIEAKDLRNHQLIDTRGALSEAVRHGRVGPAHT